MRGMTLKHAQFEYSEQFILIHTEELKLIKIKKVLFTFYVYNSRTKSKNASSSEYIECILEH